MKDSLRTLCETFIENRDILTHHFRWENSQILSLCASLFLGEKMRPDPEKLKACRDLIRRSAGVFSVFRSSHSFPLVCLLSMDKDPQRKLERAMEIFRDLKESYRSSDYLALAAFMMTDFDCSREKIERGQNLYRIMNQEHPILTSREDTFFTALMAFSPRSDDRILQDMEELYRRLKERFRDSNCVQTMAEILATEEGDSGDKCDRVFRIYDRLKENGRKYGRHNELATLAALAVTDTETDELVRDILDADAFLATQKGYGLLGPGAQARLMHAAMIVSDGLVSHDAMNRAALSGTIAQVIAQEIALCAMVTSTAAVSAASHS